AAKVHLDVQFTRYRADNSVIGSFRSLWIVIEDGGTLGRRGAVELRGIVCMISRPPEVQFQSGRTNSGGWRTTVRRIDLANSPSFEDNAVLEFFETAGRNLLPAEAAAGVRHHVALSIVGTDRSDNGYFRAKVAQEKLIEASGVPYTIIRSTQFMEF